MKLLLKEKKNRKIIARADSKKQKMTVAINPSNKLPGEEGNGEI